MELWHIYDAHLRPILNPQVPFPSIMTTSACCGKGFEWDGTPSGRTVPFPTTSNQAYITGSATDAAVMLIADLFGWEYPNIRLLADHLAREAEVTVYVPDLYLPTSIFVSELPLTGPQLQRRKPAPRPS